MYDDHRLFLHGINQPAGKLRTKHFQVTKQGTTQDGVRVRRIQSSHPAVHPSYQHGIMIEPPGQKPYIVYGDNNTINEAAKAVETDPGRVYNRLRFVNQSPSNQYYIGKPAPERMTVEMSAPEMEKAATAHKLFPNQGAENRPLSRGQEEIRAARDHIREIATEKYGGSHPSSAEGQAWVEAAVQAAESAVNPPATLATGTPSE